MGGGRDRSLSSTTEHPTVPMTTQPSAPVNPRFPDSAYVHRALLQRNYFPARSWHRDELPPCFATADLSPEVADSLSDVPDVNRWYDYVHYRLTRHANSTRLLSLPHPVPYARLSRQVVNSWDAIVEKIARNTESVILPRMYEDDSLISFGRYGEEETEEDAEELGRVVIHNHPASQHEYTTRRLELSIGKRYLVKADIAAFFPSVYTHTIPWVFRGMSEAKKNAKDDHFANLIDRYSCQIQRGETAGIPVGPGTSHIISELILEPVDAHLRRKGYRFLRRIDDYRCYCESRGRAEEFISTLEEALASYRLNLNSSKTSVVRLPSPRRDPWLAQLRDQVAESDIANPSSLENLFDMAIALQRKWPSSNVVKYAARTIARKAELCKEVKRCARYMLEMSFHYPSVIPILAGLIERGREAVRHEEVELLLRRQLKYQRSDVVCWALFMWRCLGEDRSLPDNLVDEVLEGGDCMAIVTLRAIGQGEERIVKLVEDLKPGEKSWTYDRFWLLIHEVGARATTTKEYREKTGLRGLAESGVTFIDESCFSTDDDEEGIPLEELDDRW